MSEPFLANLPMSAPGYLPEERLRRSQLAHLRAAEAVPLAQPPGRPPRRRAGTRAPGSPNGGPCRTRRDQLPSRSWTRAPAPRTSTGAMPSGYWSETPGVGVSPAGDQLVQARLGGRRPSKPDRSSRGRSSTSVALSHGSSLPVRSSPRTLVAWNPSAYLRSRLDAPHTHQPEEELVVPPLPAHLARETLGQQGNLHPERELLVQGHVVAGSGAGGHRPTWGSRSGGSGGRAQTVVASLPSNRWSWCASSGRGAKITSTGPRDADVLECLLDLFPVSGKPTVGKTQLRRPGRRGRSGAGRHTPRGHVPPCPSAPPRTPTCPLAGCKRHQGGPPHPISMSSG